MVPAAGVGVAMSTFKAALRVCAVFLRFVDRHDGLLSWTSVSLVCVLFVFLFIPTWATVTGLGIATAAYGYKRFVAHRANNEAAMLAAVVEQRNGELKDLRERMARVENRVGR